MRKNVVRRLLPPLSKSIVGLPNGVRCPEGADSADFLLSISCNTIGVGNIPVALAGNNPVEDAGNNPVALAGNNPVEDDGNNPDTLAGGAVGGGAGNNLGDTIAGGTGNNL